MVPTVCLSMFGHNPYREFNLLILKLIHQYTHKTFYNVFIHSILSIHASLLSLLCFSDYNPTSPSPLLFLFSSLCSAMYSAALPLPLTCVVSSNVPEQKK